MASPDAEGVKLLKAAGLDFLAFEAEHTPASALLDGDVGYVLIVPANPEELFLRSLEPLNLEALFLHDVPQPLTVAKQIDLRVRRCWHASLCWPESAPPPAAMTCSACGRPASWRSWSAAWTR